MESSASVYNGRHSSYKTHVRSPQKVPKGDTQSADPNGKNSSVHHSMEPQRDVKRHSSRRYSAPGLKTTGSRDASHVPKNERQSNTDASDALIGKEVGDKGNRYATWDRSLQKKKSKLDQKFVDVSASDSNPETSRNYHNISRSISTDLATIRSKAKLVNSVTNYAQQNKLLPNNKHFKHDENEGKKAITSESQASHSEQYWHTDSDLFNHNKDTYIDIDSLLNNDLHANLVDDDEFFPKLEGYRRHGLKHNFPSAPYKRIKHVSDANVCSTCCCACMFLFGAFFLLLPLSLIILIGVPIFFIIKKLYVCFCCYGRKCYDGEPLCSKEKKWAHDLKHNSMIFQSMVVLEYGLNLIHFRELINTRVILAENEKGEKLYPKLTKKIVKGCSGSIWVKDSDFVVSNHVSSIPKHVETMEDLTEYISEMSTQPLNYEHPLWEVLVLTDFGDQRDSVLLVRVHPCVADGISLVQLLCRSIADMDSVTIKMPKLYSESNFTHQCQAVATGPLLFFKDYLCQYQDFNMFHGKHVHLSGKNVVAWSEPFSMEIAKRISQVTRSKLNDVLLSVVSGCLRNYLQLNGVDNPFNINVLMPVHYVAKHPSFPNDNNDLLLMRIPLPTNIEGAIPRLWEVKKNMDIASGYASFTVTKGLQYLSSCILPETWNQIFWQGLYNKCTCLVSNIPGPEIQLRIAAKQVKSIVCWMPPIDKVAIAISFVSYGDHILMSVITDRAVLPNPEVLTKDFNKSMDILAELLSNRRILTDQPSPRAEKCEIDCEIREEQSVAQIQMRMSSMQKEINDLKMQLERNESSDHKEKKIRNKIELLKESLRDLLVEMRKRKAAEVENAVILTDEDQDIEDDEDHAFRKPYRRRTLSLGSRLSTASASSTVRPLAATTPTTPVDYSADDDAWSQVSTRTDGVSSTISGRPTSSRHHQRNQFEIIEYAHSPSLERRFRTF